MTATTEAGTRILTLDIVRGIAVMGILAMNIIAFAMPFQAYMNPLVYGLEGTADFVSWLVSFVFIDGRMRGLFSFLFGASLLLVIQKAQAQGEPAVKVHFSRMFWLLLFGLFHLYFIWFGDILSLYAPVGMIAWLYRDKLPRSLIGWGIGLLVFQLVVFAMLSASYFFVGAQVAQPNPDPALVQQWADMTRDLTATPAQVAADLALYRGGYAEIVGHRLSEMAMAPVFSLFLFGWETLAYMLFGMAALKTGFLTGQWDNGRYRRTLLIGFGIGVPAYLLLAWLLVRADFAVPMLFAISMTATTVVRPLMIVATAALIVLLTRRGGALVDRIAATGRAAFTNYLGTSLVMTTLFYGYGAGLYGTMGRAEAWIPVVVMWALMLLWSKPWLDRYRYGPFEWLWRSLSRGRLEPMRKPLAPPAAIPAE